MAGQGDGRPGAQAGRWAWALLCTSGGAGGRGWAPPAVLRASYIPVRQQGFSLKNGHQLSQLSGEDHMKDEKARLICSIKIKKYKHAVLMETVFGNVPREGASITIGGSVLGGSRGAPSRVCEGAEAMSPDVLQLDKILRMK